MKTAVKIFCISLFFLSCSSSDNDNSNQLNRLIEGKWRLTTKLYYEDTDENQIYEHPVDNGYLIDFKNDGTFTSNESVDPTIIGGRYSISNDSIISFTYQLSGSINVKRKKIVTSSDLELILEGVAEDGNPCYGGCGERFQKVTDTNTN